MTIRHKTRYLLPILAMLTLCYADDVVEDSLDLALLDAMTYYYNGHYYNAIRRLEYALAHSKGGDRIAAHKFLAFSYFAVENKELAKEHFVKILSIDPKFQLDSLAVSHELYEVFVKAKETRSGEAAACSCFIPGSAQFLRGEDTKGIIIMGVSGLTALASVYSWFRTVGEHDEYLSLGPDERDKIEQEYREYNRWYKISLATTGLLAVIYVYSIFDALPLGNRSRTDNKNEDHGFVFEENSEHIRIGYRIHF